MAVPPDPLGTPAPPAAPSARFTVFLTSYLVGLLKYAGPVCAPRAAAAFLRRAGNAREVFLPFFYRWFDQRQWAQDQALRLIRASVVHDGMTPPHVFHAPFPGRRHGLVSRSYYRDLADPATAHENQIALQRECAFFGRVRREFDMQKPVLYILHLGWRAGRRASEALNVALSVLRPAVAVAAEHGVILALENVADRRSDQDHVGASLREVEDALGTLGEGESGSDALGWTFDVSHALLAYRGDRDAVARDVQRLLPRLVHVHINAARVSLPEHTWADRHEAPTAGFPPLWDLFRLALTSARFQSFRGITYEVNWAAPVLNPLVGGSPLPAVVRGYELVRSVAAEVLGTLDAAVGTPYPVPRLAEKTHAPLAPERDPVAIPA